MANAKFRPKPYNNRKLRLLWRRRRRRRRKNSKVARNPERMSYRSMLSVSSCQENEAGIQKVVCFE